MGKNSSGGGAPRNPILTAMWAIDPPRASHEVSEALHAAQGAIGPAAVALGVAPRTLYRWVCTKPALEAFRTTNRTAHKTQDSKKEAMKPRQVRGLINRAKKVYVACPYNAEDYFFVSVTKGAARDLAKNAEPSDGPLEDVVCFMSKGDLYIGNVGAPASSGDTDDSE